MTPMYSQSIVDYFNEEKDRPPEVLIILQKGQQIAYRRLLNADYVFQRKTTGSYNVLKDRSGTFISGMNNVITITDLQFLKWVEDNFDKLL